MTLSQSRINADLVIPICECLHLIVRQAESPILSIIRGSVGDPFWTFGDGEQMWPNLLQGHYLTNRATVVQHVQVASLKVHNAISGRILYICVPNIPFSRDIPVEHLCTGRYFGDLQRNPALNACQRLPYSIPRDTSANRIE